MSKHEEKINRFLKKMDYLRAGGKVECSACDEGYISMIDRGVYQCNHCGYTMIGRIKPK